MLKSIATCTGLWNFICTMHNIYKCTTLGQLFWSMVSLIKSELIREENGTFPYQFNSSCLVYVCIKADHHIYKLHLKWYGVYCIPTLCITQRDITCVIGHFGVVFLSKELYSHCTSHPAVKPSWTCVYSPASFVMTPVTLLGPAWASTSGFENASLARLTIKK